ncbi:MAG: hypothetical protein HKN21_16020 [Candidatus Eisenbacteria bacterium]|uniref:DUF4404 family protein n=1 Tax=Eiseniibacteriota bacterium TaxID=2212470 RepID=A0A7Y2H3L8_UNCEI|nr:hypothetical protein [Candidatus Eisenbacteria bacterium]
MLIDWEDPQELFGMLMEFVADSRQETQSDAHRDEILGTLVEDLEASQWLFEDATPKEVAKRLRELEHRLEGLPPNDPVVEELTRCLEELDGLAEGA